MMKEDIMAAGRSTGRRKKIHVPAARRVRVRNAAAPGRQVRRGSLARLVPLEIKGVWGAEAPQGLLDPRGQWDCQAPLVPED